jgi:dTDP-glucose 4,6-dehydratase
MKLVVITGCLGLIGHHVTRNCLEKGWKVFGIDKMTYAANKWALDEFLQNPNFTFLQEDICSLSKLPDCDYVINLAAETHVENSITNSDNFISSNVLGTQRILELIRNKHNNVFKRPTLIHFSTDEVYGDIKHGSHTESDVLKPSNPYSASKASADMLIMAWSRTYNIDYVIIRPTNNYGIGQYPEKFIPLCVKLLSVGRKINLHDHGNPVRSWLHADDTADAVITIIESGKTNEIYNISGNLEQRNIVTATKIVETFRNKALEKEEESNYFNLEFCRIGQDVRYSLDDSKLRSLGWAPKKQFDLELPKIVDYYKTNFRW